MNYEWFDKMAEKKIPISVRLSAEESAFLAGYSAPGATTHSEKLRALIDEARQLRGDTTGQMDQVTFMDALFTPVLRDLRNAEAATGERSELLRQVGYILPELVAFFLSSVPKNRQRDNTEDELRRLEDGVADRLFALFELICRMAVTERNPCYDESAINKRIVVVQEILSIVKSTTKAERENKK